MTEDEIRYAIISNCGEYISQLRNCKLGNVLLRGSFQNIRSIKRFDHNLDYRKPLHTPIDVHNLVNESFETKFGWKIRNGAFCYGFNLSTDELPIDLGYGPFFIFCPIGNFKIVYSPSMSDLYGYISTTKTPVRQLIKCMDFRDSTLCTAIESGEHKHENVSNEISVHTSSYFLVNISYRKLVFELIWNSI